MINVVAGPECARGSPEHNELGRATPNVWHLVEKLGAALLTEVPVTVHWRVRIVVTEASSAPLGTTEETLTEASSADEKDLELDII